MASEARTKVPKRRFYSPGLKLQVIGQCGQPSASIAAVALMHCINANIVHRWLREHAQGTLARPTPSFLPVTLNDVPRQAATILTPPQIRVEVQRANATVVVYWPVQDAATCAQWLREWLA